MRLQRRKNLHLEEQIDIQQPPRCCQPVPGRPVKTGCCRSLYDANRQLPLHCCLWAHIGCRATMSKPKAVR